MTEDDLAAEPDRRRPLRRPPRVAWRYRIAAAYLALMVGAVALYDTPDAARRRRLAAAHARAAARCRHQARTLRAAGRVEEAGHLSRTARNHEWFADAHRGLVRRPPSR